MPDPAPPTDLEQVRAAFRLGWAVAELRGRYRPDLFLHPEPGIADEFKRSAKDPPLPLAIERKHREVRIEVFRAATGLSGLLDLSLKINDTDALELIQHVTSRMEETNAVVRRRMWGAVARTFYSWDAQLQDALVVPATRAAGYQLGRALAETHWALDPARPDNEMGSVAFLFGPTRQRTVKRLIARLSAYLGPLVSAAVEGSFDTWCTLALHPPQFKDEKVRAALYQQGLLWRDLIRGERQPLDLTPVTANDAWKEVQVYSRAMETLRWPLVAGGAFAVLLIAGGAMLASGAKDPALTTAISILGALGLTSASIYARAKAELTSLLANLRLAVDQERVSQAANVLPLPAPPRPHDDKHA